MTAIATKQTGAESLEKVLIGGDLANLSSDERILYYKKTCESLGLNPLTKPFEYIKLNGKLTLYARKDATDQLRKLNGVSIEKPDIQQIESLIIVTVAATDKNGRSDSDIGVVNKGDMNGNLANALMKAVTKAKRRVTLSICGLGMLDETEVDAIPKDEIEYVQPATKTQLIENARENRVVTPEEISLRQQLEEICVKFDMTAGLIDKTLFKFDDLATLSDKEDMVAGARQKLEARMRETKITSIKEGLGNQDWDIDETAKYLEQFSVEAIDAATDEQIEAVHNDMKEGKMI